MLEPIITEKSTKLAKVGKYTFRVGVNSTKHQVKALITSLFGVHVVSIRTINSKKKVSRNYLGKKRVAGATKKAIITLKKGEKIDLFEEGKKK